MQGVIAQDGVLEGATCHYRIVSLESPHLKMFIFEDLFGSSILSLLPYGLHQPKKLFWWTLGIFWCQWLLIIRSSGMLSVGLTPKRCKPAIPVAQAQDHWLAIYSTPKFLGVLILIFWFLIYSDDWFMNYDGLVDSLFKDSWLEFLSFLWLK